MTKYRILLQDETKCEFIVEQTAASKADAIKQVEEDYTESTVIEIMTEAEAEQRLADIYRQHELAYDDIDYDDYGY